MDKLGGVGCEGDYFGFVYVENQFVEQWCGGIVEVDGSLVGVVQCFKGVQDQWVLCLGQYLDGDIFWDVLFVNQLVDKVEIGL